MFYWWFSHGCPVIFANKNTVNNQRTDTASRNVSTIKFKINIAFWFSYLVTRQLARSQSRTASIIFLPTDQMFERFINFVRFRTVALYRCQLKIKFMGNADWWLSYLIALFIKVGCSRDVKCMWIRDFCCKKVQFFRPLNAGRKNRSFFFQIWGNHEGGVCRSWFLVCAP